MEPEDGWRNGLWRPEESSGVRRNGTGSTERPKLRAVQYHELAISGRRRGHDIVWLRYACMMR